LTAHVVLLKSIPRQLSSTASIKTVYTSVLWTSFPASPLNTHLSMSHLDVAQHDLRNKPPSSSLDLIQCSRYEPNSAVATTTPGGKRSAPCSPDSEATSQSPSSTLMRRQSEHLGLEDTRCGHLSGGHRLCRELATLSTTAPPRPWRFDHPCKVLDCHLGGTVAGFRIR